MTYTVADRVKETTTTTGTGDVTLGGAAAGYRAFSSVLADGDIVPYVISTAAAYEVGIGRYNSSGTTLTRLEVKASSNAGALVAFAAGTKDVAITVLAAMLTAPTTYPFAVADGLMLRVNASLSRTDFTSGGYAKKIYDISGNGYHSDLNTFNAPRWSQSGFNRHLPGWWFSGAMRHTFSTLPGLASPLACTIVLVGSDWAVNSGNSHLYNWGGQPIGFGAVTGLEYTYNGILPAENTAAVGIVATDVLPDNRRLPAALLHVYNGALSVNSINNSEFPPGNVGTAATGTTNYFTVGSDSSGGIAASAANFSKMLLWELAVYNIAMSALQRATLLAYYRQAAGLAFQ